MFDLTGQAALVTGASGGIGGAIARALHKQGAAVTLSGTRADALEQLKASLGERAHVVAAKMDDAAEIDRLAALRGQEINEATGNEGVSMDRWYRQAVLVLWPRQRYFAILAEEDLIDIGIHEIRFGEVRIERHRHDRLAQLARERLP